MGDDRRDAAQVAHNHLRQIIINLRHDDITAALEQALFACRVLREQHGAEDLPVVNSSKRPAPTPRRRK